MKEIFERSVEDLMNRKVIRVSPDEYVESVAELMLRENVQTVLVVDGDSVLGVLTPFDYLKIYTERLNPQRTRVRDIMTPGIIKVRENTPITEAARIMFENKINYLFVESIGDGRIIGVLSTSDLIKETFPRLMAGPSPY